MEPLWYDTTNTTTAIDSKDDSTPSISSIVELKDDDDDDDDDDETDTNSSDNDKTKERTIALENYLYHLLYAGQQLLQLESTGNTSTSSNHTENNNDNDDSTMITESMATTEEEMERQQEEEFELYRNYHTQQLQAFITTKQNQTNSNGSSGSSSNGSIIPKLIDEMIHLLLQMGQLSFLASSNTSSLASSKRTKLFQFFLPPRPPDHIYYAHDLRPYTSPTMKLSTMITDVNDMEEEEDGPIEESHSAAMDTSYQYRCIDLVRRFLRCMAPIAMDIVARMVEQCVTTMNTTTSSSSNNNNNNTLATYIIIGIWLPVASHILPLVTHFLQQLRLSPSEWRSHRNDKEPTNVVDGHGDGGGEPDDVMQPEQQQLHQQQLHHPLYYSKQLWLQHIHEQKLNSNSVSLSTPVLSSSTSVGTTNMQQIGIIMEVTWMICQIYKRQQNSQTLRNLPTWFWEPIFMWLQYDNDTIGIPQNNYFPSDHFHPNINNSKNEDSTKKQSHDRMNTSLSTDNKCNDDAMMVDPPLSSDETMNHNNDDNEQEDEEIDNESRRKFRITREEWTYEIQIMWYVIRIVAYLRSYTPICTKELMLRYHVYYHHHYVPWHIHDYDMNDEETFYQHIHVAFGYTYLGPYLSHTKNQVALPNIRTVRAYLPLHPYLVHLGRGLVFVKYPLPTSSATISSSVHSSQSNHNLSGNNENQLGLQIVDTSKANLEQQQHQCLIRTTTTKKNIYEIGTIMCIQPPVPILVAGPNGSGKSSLVQELAREFHHHPSSNDAGMLEHQQLLAAPLLEIHVDDETDTKTLVGSYTVTDIPGEFEWRPGALTSAVMSGQWVLFEDFDTIPIDIQASLEPLFKYRTLPLGNGTTITCHPNFRLFGTITTSSSVFATTKNQSKLSSSESGEANMNQPASRPKMMIGRGRRLFNAQVWTTVQVDPLPLIELNEIGMAKYPNIPVSILDAIISIFYALQDDSQQSRSKVSRGNNSNSENIYAAGKKKLWVGRNPSVRDLLKILSRVSHGIQFERNASYVTESQRVLCLAEIVDVFVAACPDSLVRREFVAQVVAPILNITADLGISYVERRNPTILMHDATTEIGRVQIGVTPDQGEARSYSNRFAQTPYSLRMMESIGVCVRENEPTLLVGETGTGKTTILQHLAKCCGRELIVQNLSLQTDSTDLLGGYRPLEIKHVARTVYQSFVDLFTGTFSRKQNADFLAFASMSLQKEQWTKLSQCFHKAAQLGLAKLNKKDLVSSNISAWKKFNLTAERFEKQRLACASGLAFNFTEGALVDAIRTGKWVLLDEINLASSETLQRLCGLLDSALSSLTLTERGDAAAVDRHSAFRLFAAMNPATDSGKKDLPSSIRARFTELFVDELLDPVQLRVVAAQYISGVLQTNDCPPENTDIVIAVVDVYSQCRDLAERVLVDGSGQKPRYTLRTLSRALSAANTIVREQKLPLNRALYEGFQLSFQGPVDDKSLKIVDKLLVRSLSIGAEKSFLDLDHPGKRPGGRNDAKSYELIKPFWIAKGPLDSVDWSINDEKTGCSRFILVPSTLSNLRRLARAIASGPWPLLLEGPTSAGKTTLVEYIAARCGHRVVRINNHEHTDVQEYTGGFAADSTGSLKFVDGILVQALRLGHWVILDELNLAPSEVLEALNRLLDDNRELYIPEINETIKPHERFRLFATQNPSGVYGGRKPLSRAFRNRFVEIQINDIPSCEMATILEKRCGCPPTHAKCLVEVMDALRQRRSKSGIFLGKDGLITPRDLLRWADRGASSKIELGIEGYMLLAERLRSREEQQCVKDVLEKHLKVKLDMDNFYYGKESEAKLFLDRAYEIASLDENAATFIKSIAPTKNLLRLITLVHRCVSKNEPVLLIGETGCGKTVTVQLLSVLLHLPLHAINCHQTTETSDLIGGLRPVRGRNMLLSKMVNLTQQVFALLPDKDFLLSDDIPDVIKSTDTFVEDVVSPHDLALKIMNFISTLRATVSFANACESKLTERIKKRPKLGDHLNSIANDTDLWLDITNMVEEIERLCCRFNSLFEWVDGPLVTAMKNGELILLDEISLADDAVLERLNSVLEPARTIILAEKGAVDENDSQYVKAHPTFQLFATMNPGGDFGKRELSPALRSRFTEIWVPPVTDFEDIGLVLEHALARCTLQPSCLSSKTRILEYVEWFNGKVCTESACSFMSLSLSLRDILSWAHFMVESRKANNTLGIWEAYLHGARLMHLDGLGLGGGLSIRDAYAIRNRAELFLTQQTNEENGQSEDRLHFELSVSGNLFGVHPFWIPVGSQPIFSHSFNFGAPTTAKNVFRVLRAMQVSKPILLEGSPGVGKTTLIGALAESSGHTLVRINLSDQTDITDLIGSDLPVSDSNDTSRSLGSSFRWVDGVLLTAIKNGDWVLLDELNLASQSVLEGLNSCLDHRSSVFVPELGQSFNCPPSFRIFAAQNPMGQGGGRKGLPKSFLNRFTKVYVDSLDYNDLQMIVKSSFPGQRLVDKMVMFNAKVSAASAEGCSLGRLGSPWEFNLRDVFRWCELFAFHGERCNGNPGESLNHFRFARDLYMNRFRSALDRDIVKLIYDDVFDAMENDTEPPTLVVSEREVRLGDVRLPRKVLSSSSMYEMDDLDLSIPVELYEPMEAVARCIVIGWPCLLVGKTLSGKDTIVRSLAKLTNSTITEIFLSSSSDVSELVGCFEREDNFNFVVENAKKIIQYADKFLLCSLSSVEREVLVVQSFKLEQSLKALQSQIDDVLANASKLVKILISMARQTGKWKGDIERLMIVFQNMSEKGKIGLSSSSDARFSWKDGALVKAMREGHWLHLRNANLCSSSVLDRLNSVLEPCGYLLLAESGLCDESNTSKPREVKCHPNFRVILSMNPDHGEVSRAMRNRCVEVSILERTANESMDVLDFCHAFAKSGLRMGQLARNLLQQMRSNMHSTSGTSSDFRSINIRFVMFTSLVSRGMRRINSLLQDFPDISVKVDCNTIEYIPYTDDILHWSLFPECTTVQVWARVLRMFVGSIQSLISDGNAPSLPVSGMWSAVIEGVTTTSDFFSSLIYSSRSMASIRDNLMSLLAVKAEPRCLSKIASYFEQLSNPAKYSITFCAENAAQWQHYCQYVQTCEPISEGVVEAPFSRFCLPFARIQSRRTPQLFSERLWHEKIKFAFSVENLHKLSVLGVSYNLSVGNHRGRVVDCPVTPFLSMLFRCLQDVVQSILDYAPTLFDHNENVATIVDNFLTHRDGLWNLLAGLKFVPNQANRPCFAINDFVAQWLLLRRAYEKLLPFLSAITNVSDEKGRLDVVIETIEQGIFDFSKGEHLCGSAVMRKECAPAVPRRVDRWHLLLKARSIGRMCLVERRSFLTIYEHSMMTIRNCYERYPVLFVLDQSFKKDVLGMLCTIQIDDIQETSIQGFAVLQGAVSEVPFAVESHLVRLLNTFQAELNIIQLKRSVDSCTFNVDELVDALERNDVVQETYVKLSECLLRTFADIQISASFENWCESTEADFLRLLCCMLVTKGSISFHESIASFLVVLKKFVNVAISQSLWDLADLRPYQTIIWLCESTRLSDIDWRHCIKKLMPAILLNVSKRTWLRSLDLHEYISLSLELPSIHDTGVSPDFSAAGRTEKQARSLRWTRSEGLTMSLVFSLLQNALKYEDSYVNRVKFATIENYVSRDVQSCRLVELMSASSAALEEKPFDIAFLFDEVITGFSELIPNRLIQDLKSFLSHPQMLRLSTYEELLKFGSDSSSSILRTCIHLILLPLLRCLENLWSSDSISTTSDYALSKVYIGLLRFHLLLPISPIDPGRFPLAKMSVIDRRLATLGSEITALRLDSIARVGRNFTGNDATLRVLNEGHELVSSRGKLERSVIERPQRGPAFSELYEETLTFSRTHFSFDTVLALQNIISCEVDTPARQREHNWQSTAEAFCENLLLKYEEYEDIVVPLATSVGIVKHGIQLLLESKEKKVNDDLQSAVFLSSTFPLRDTPSTCGKLYAILKSDAYQSNHAQEFRLTVSQSLLSQIVLMSKLVALNEKLMQNWLNVLDCITDHLNEHTGSSRPAAMSDEEKEIALHAQFPNHRLEFVESNESNDQTDSSNELVGIDSVGSLDTLSLSDSFREVLCFLHEMLFGESKDAIDDFYRIKMFRLCFSAAQKANELFGNKCCERDIFTICAPGLVMALALISPSSQHLVIQNRIFDSEIDFHRDPNPHESMKAAGPLRRLMAKITQLLVIFPDNTILVEIAKVCDRVCKLDLHRTSLGRVLTGLELILKHAQDWEQHATIRVRLGDPLIEIRRLVAGWRKLELQSWAELLNTREGRFARRGREHWTKIHIVLRRYIAALTDENTLTSCTATPRWAWKGIRQDVQKLTFFFSEGCKEELLEIMKVFDTFCLTSPLGEFHTRLQLLRAFGRQVKMEASFSPTKHSLLQLSLSLQALWQYYNQFSALVKSTLVKQRRPFETRLEQEIKLAKWDEQTYYAMTESTERNHRKLMNIIFDYDNVLNLDVMSCIDSELARGIQSDLKSGTENCTTIPGLTILFPLESNGDCVSPIPRQLSNDTDSERAWTDASQIASGQGVYFYKLCHLSKRMIALLEKPIGSIHKKGFSAVTDLSETIFGRIESLRSEKTTRPMKERALTDLLKELKRHGYSPNKWSTPSEMQHISELFQLPCPSEGINNVQFIDPNIAKSAERYYQRSLAESYRFRAEISMYGSEFLTTRQLDMMHSFSEHGLYLVVQQRCIVSCIIAQRQQLARLIDSMSLLSGKGLLTQQSNRKATFSSLIQEFAYCIESLRQLVLLMKSSQHLMDTTKKQKWSGESIMKIEAFLSLVEVPTFLEEIAYVSTNEVDKVQKMTDDLDMALTTVKLCREESVSMQCLPAAAFSTCENQIKSLVESMNNFLHDVKFISTSNNGADTHVESFSRASSIAIEYALLFAQICLNDIDSIETDDQSMVSIWDMHIATSKTWKALNVQKLVASFQSVLSELTEIHETETIDSRTRDLCTGFACDIGYLYSSALTLHDKILGQYFSFYRGTAKLQYILLRIFRVLRASGFCSSSSKEVDKQENADGGTSGMTFEDDKDGTGMGEGDGKTDVTDQLENEEQLLGLKNDKDDADPMKPPPDPKQLNKEEADQGMEMEGDFDGELHDLPDEIDGDDNDDKDNANDREEIDREMGQDGSPNEEVIDEKLWDEDDDTGKQDSKEEKFEQNSSVKGDGAAEEMITKDENEVNDESKDADKSNETAQPEKRDDMVNEEESGKINEDTDENYEDNRGVNVRDESQMNDEQDGINLDENISIDEDPDKHDDEMSKQMDESELDEEKENATDPTQPVIDDTNAESDNENDADPVPEVNSMFGQIQPHDDDCPDEELPEDEHEIPRASLQNESISHSGLGVMDKDGGDALLEDAVEESEEMQKDSDGKGADDGSGKMELDSTGGGQGAGSATGQNVSDTSDGAATQPESNDMPNPLKNPGDASKFWHRKLNVMKSLLDVDNEGESMDDQVDEKNGEGTFEYTNETNHNATQTLGEADDNEAVQLDHKEEDRDNEGATKEISNSKQVTPTTSTQADRRNKSTSASKDDQDRKEDVSMDENAKAVSDLENAGDEEEKMLTDEVAQQTGDELDAISENHVVSDMLQLRFEDSAVNLLNKHQSIVETEQTTGHSTAEISDALTRWSVIQGETHSLSRRLCEKLRLVMEPLVASKLRGDYRTGKRINMKRVIGYIASGYRKDKIWLRRTKPAKRNYRVLVAVDDSESMLKNGAGDMALKAMATLAMGMSQLEVGEVGIASFGNEMNLVHPFEQPFTSESGPNIVQSFQFKQQRTRTALCIESAMLALEGQHGDHGAMQLVFMISDGRIERDSRSSIRKYIREMMEQNILLVLIIVEGSDSKKDSIMNMKEVTFDKGKPQFKHFIDDYPFPYYIVLNDMQALPEVLGDALKQWFEMLARLQSNS